MMPTRHPPKTPEVSVKATPCGFAVAVFWSRRRAGVAQGSFGYLSVGALEQKMTIYWTRETDTGFVAETEDGDLFRIDGDILCRTEFNDFLTEFNRHREKGDRLFPGPPPPPHPGDDADTDELERWMDELGEALVSNSLDDSDDEL